LEKEGREQACRRRKEGNRELGGGRKKQKARRRKEANKQVGEGKEDIES
jgi:hypothetical protein